MVGMADSNLTGGKGSLLARSLLLPLCHSQGITHPFASLPQAGKAAEGPGLGEGVPENTGVPHRAASSIPKTAVTSRSECQPHALHRHGGSAASSRRPAPHWPGAGWAAWVAPQGKAGIPGNSPSASQAPNLGGCKKQWG